MDTPALLALTLHTLAMIMVLGYYAVLRLVLLPALRRTLVGPQLGEAVASVERRAFPIVGLSVVAFIASGVYLLGVDESFAGFGNFTASTWATLMAVKHLVVLAMVGLAFAIHALVGGVAGADSEPGRETALGMLGLATEVMLALGVLVVGLTTAAQLS